MATLKPIDLSGLNDEREAATRALIAEACEKNGFFQIINHGVPVELLEKLREQGKLFFDLPKEQKLQYAGKPVIGAEGYGSRMVLDAEPQFWREFIELHTLPLSQRHHNYWPKQPVEFSETVEKYTAAMLDLAHRLLAIISENLGLKPSHLKDAMGETNQNIVFQCYPPCPEPGKTLGLPAHADLGGITILMQEGEGLQVAGETDDTWETVPPYQNAFVVNLADQIEILTNGIYKSANHRAIVNSDRTRRSYVTFYHPAKEQKIFPIPELVDAKVGPKFRELIYLEYLQALAGGRAAGKRLVQSFAIQPPPHDTTARST